MHPRLDTRTLPSIFRVSWEERTKSSKKDDTFTASWHVLRANQNSLFPRGSWIIPEKEGIIWFMLSEDSTHNPPADHLLEWFLL